MRRIFGMFILNLRILFAEKVTLVWVLLIPTIIFISSSRNFMGEAPTDNVKITFISIFWAFIIISSIFNGVGIHIARLRNMNLLKTYTLIAGTKLPIISGIVLTQLVFCIINIVVFTIVASLWLSMNPIHLIFIPIIILLILFLPLSLVSLLFTSVPMRDSALTLIVNIGLYSLFLLAVSEQNHIWTQIINLINPFTFVISISELIFNMFRINNYLNIIYFSNIISYLILSIAGIISYKNLSLVSKDYRT